MMEILNQSESFKNLFNKWFLHKTEVVLLLFMFQYFFPYIFFSKIGIFKLASAYCISENLFFLT